MLFPTRPLRRSRKEKHWGRAETPPGAAADRGRNVEAANRPGGEAGLGVGAQLMRREDESSYTRLTGLGGPWVAWTAFR